MRRVLLLLLVLPAACSGNDCKSGDCPDAVPCPAADAVPADAGRQDDADASDAIADAAPEVRPSACQMGVVKCEAGETDVYGLCVADLEIPFTGGTFDMGADKAADASPVHNVTVGAFSIDRTEVTNAMYAACVDCGQCSLPMRDGSFTAREPYFLNPEFNACPVVHVTWQQARDFCEGLGRRLPTEAEWEFAARGPEGRKYPWGDTAPAFGFGNIGGFHADTEMVGKAADGATPDGILDLAGNVWEWVEDTYYSDIYTWLGGEDPVAPPGDGLVKVVRGGCFASAPADAQAHVRNFFEAEAHFATVGFRCAQ
jgi:formylglycine-generating enzyme required for sulfatase activity